MPVRPRDAALFLSEPAGLVGNGAARKKTLNTGLDEIIPDNPLHFRK